MNKKEYKKSLENEFEELQAQIEILRRFKDFLEEQLQIYEEEIDEKDDRLTEINEELNELEGNMWGADQYTDRDYMNDVL